MNLKILSALSLIALFSACGGKKSFQVDVDAPVIGTQEITIVYETTSGNREIIRVPAIEGKFEFSGIEADSTTVEIYNAKHLLVCAFPISRGEKLNLRSENDSLYIDGASKPIIKSYADTTLSDWPKFESPELLILNDSTLICPPEGIWVFTSSIQERNNSLIDTLRYYAERNDSVRDVYVSGDLSSWRSYTRHDSATWTQGLLPDAPLLLRGILLSTPCLVEVDTLGNVLRIQRLE